MNSPDEAPQFEALVIGAGVCGIYQAYRLKELGLSSVVLERGTDVGGTWHWNRYPGCRFDSESETYGYSFSPELLAEWDWKEHFAPRAETENYLRHVANKFGLYAMVQVNSAVTAAHWHEARRSWTVTLADGRELQTRFLLTAVGLLSAPTLPRYPGVADFKGVSFHTYHAPREPVDYAGKRVAVVGTGATGVQVICDLAAKVGSLTVFQRRPNWCAPLNNSPMSAEQMQEIKRNYPRIFEACRNTPSGFVHDVDPRRTLEVPPAERDAFWEQLYAGSGFGIWLGNFKDILTDTAANAEFSKFVAAKIRQRVKNPALADKLIPKDHGFGSRRVPMETRYYEVYNQDNVELVDVSETPIERVTATGIQTSTREFEFDIIIYATGFDAIVGSFDRMDIVGRDGLRLKDKWREGPVTGYGMAVHGFPNLLTLAGPQSGSVATNFPRGIEEAVDWCTGLLRYMRQNGQTRVEVLAQTEVTWGEHVQDMTRKILFGRERSWFTGYNSNVDREYTNKVMIYAGGAIRYRDFLGRETTKGYPGFELS
jgi:cation diffusion facilitator CzcD-associated flavoprotein CzcO